MGFAAPTPAGKHLLLTGTGKYFKNTEYEPAVNLGLIRLTDGGKTASIASTIEPVTCAVLGAVFLHETVTLRSASGIFLIVGATLYLFIGGRGRKEI